MNQLLDRALNHPRTSAAGLLGVALVVLTAIQQHPPKQDWTLTALAIITGLTGLLAKDK